MAKITKDQALARLAEIAEIHRQAKEAYEERADLWGFCLKAGVSQAELARISGVGRADIKKSIGRRVGMT